MRAGGGRASADPCRPFSRRRECSGRESDGRQSAIRCWEFIKVYDNVPRAAYFGIVGEAKKKQISFVGHVRQNLWRCVELFLVLELIIVHASIQSFRLAGRSQDMREGP